MSPKSGSSFDSNRPVFGGLKGSKDNTCTSSRICHGLSSAVFFCLHKTALSLFFFLPPEFAARWEDRVKLEGDLAMKTGSNAHFTIAKSSGKKRGGGDTQDSEEEDAAPPVNDIYRVRQMKRVKTET